MDRSQIPLNPLFESTLQKRQAVSLCEMRLVAWFAAKDVPFKKDDSLKTVLKASVSDSSILRQMKLKRTKVKGVIHDLMAQHECQTNSFFHHKNVHSFTWKSKDGHIFAQVDYMLIRQRWISSVVYCRVFKGANMGSKNGSDHFLLAATMGCVDYIFTLRLLLHQCFIHRLDTFGVFLDFFTAFCSILRLLLRQIMLEDGVPTKIVDLQEYTMRMP
ncbi:hypothetical protein QYM36_002521 [Artemia franciscana]|uniref:Uncharacterized protein n=1 Tax=Artemia franciscana TaxID=6661 RepID=A0AA88ID32_ARTSF|nr:hypothetical protein QYM36_002521 [Artemia franciscana]